MEEGLFEIAQIEAIEAADLGGWRARREPASSALDTIGRPSVGEASERRPSSRPRDETPAERGRRLLARRSELKGKGSRRWNQVIAKEEGGISLTWVKELIRRAEARERGEARGTGREDRLDTVWPAKKVKR
jgi:hypothetical protein